MVTVYYQQASWLLVRKTADQACARSCCLLGNCVELHMCILVVTLDRCLVYSLHCSFLQHGARFAQHHHTALGWNSSCVYNGRILVIILSFNLDDLSTKGPRSLYKGFIINGKILSTWSKWSCIPATVCTHTVGVYVILANPEAFYSIFSVQFVHMMLMWLYLIK